MSKKWFFIVPSAVVFMAVLGKAAQVTVRTVTPPPHTTTGTPKMTQTSSAAANESSDRPPSGLYVNTNEGQRAVPLKHTEVNAQISGHVSRVEVTQQFENSFANPIEAVYVFPLPDAAAVSDMEIQIGDRIIRGDIKKREIAREIYEQAKQQGRTTGLLEQERANIFTQSIANIKPGESIEVTIRYTESLPFENGQYKFVFPMVVGPRYISDSDPVGDRDRITPPVTKPERRSGHDIDLNLEIDAGIPIGELVSTSHDIQTRRQGNTVKIKLAEEESIPNRDFILRYQVASEQTQTTVLSQADSRGGHFVAYLIPAVDYEPEAIIPKDVVFLVDTSGSQSGAPLQQSKMLMRRFVRGLNPEDTFTMIDFANTTQKLAAYPLANTASNRDRALAYINSLQGGGGTELLNGIDEVLSFPPPEDGRVRNIVLLTDGYIGNETNVLDRVQRGLAAGNRLYSIGVGSSVNRFLLDRLAEVGRGTMQVIRHDESSDRVVEKFFQQINNPVLTDIQVSWEGEGSAQIYPIAEPDLFASQPLVLYGKHPTARDGKLVITGEDAQGNQYRRVLPVNFPTDGGNDAIAQLWGRAKIKELQSQMYGMETTSGVEAVTETALAYRLLSKYTAFVAVSEEVRVEDGELQRVEVPVEMPEGVSYEGVFGPASPENVANFRGRGAGNRQLSEAATSAAPALESRRQMIRPTGDVTADSQPANTIAVLEAPELDAAAKERLNRLLRSVSVGEGVRGEMVLVFTVRDNRVQNVLLDDTESTVVSRSLFQQIQQRLQRWSPPAEVSGKVRVKLQIQGNS
jgi:Ca-activated chloride channel family protein